MKRSLLILACAVPVLGHDLVRNGTTRYPICLSPQASASEDHGAQELQTFLEQMSGARLPIVKNCAAAPPQSILIGDGPAVSALKVSIPSGAEEYRIQTVGRRLVIGGGRLRGTLYGVYALLDRLGCRWFTPEVSRIPRTPTIKLLELSETGKPAFEYREPFFTEAWDRDWAARNRTNGDHTRLDAATGGKVQYYPFVHSFNELIPPEKYFASHPEYFSLIDGKRRAERSQLCLTNADVLKLTIERIEEWIQAHPDVKIFSVSQNDWEGWCECDRCRRVEEEEGRTHSGPLLRFVNAVASDVGKRHPDKLIDTLAYWYTELPPLRVKPVSNVRIRLCPIGICIAHPMEDCPKSNYFVSSLKAWGAITNQLYIWHYNTNFAHYLAPMPDFDELRADINLYRRQGVVGLFLQGAYPPGGGGENSELRAYVLARMLWDPATDTDHDVNEFLQGVYGKAAPAMRKYFDLLHREVRTLPSGLGQHLWIFILPTFSAGFREQAEALFREAAATEPDPAIRRRIAKAHLSLEYLDLVQSREYRVEGDLFSPVNLEQVKATWNGFLAKLPSLGIESIHEGRDLKWDQAYIDGMKPLQAVTLENDAVRVQVVPELAGRAIRIIDKLSNQDLLRRPEPGEGGYPAVGGLIVEAGPDYVTRPWNASWRLVSTSATEVVAQADFDNSLRLTERLTLTGHALKITAEAENRGTAVLQAALRTSATFVPDDMNSSILSFQSKAGLQTIGLLKPGRPSDGNAVFEADSLPNAGLQIKSVPQSATMDFDRTEIGRITANWSEKGKARLTLAGWSKPLTLQPGAKAVLTAFVGTSR